MASDYSISLQFEHDKSLNLSLSIFVSMIMATELISTQSKIQLVELVQLASCNLIVYVESVYVFFLARTD